MGKGVFAKIFGVFCICAFFASSAVFSYDGNNTPGSMSHHTTSDGGSGNRHSTTGSGGRGSSTNNTQNGSGDVEDIDDGDIDGDDATPENPASENPVSNGCDSGFYKPSGGDCTKCPDGFDKSDKDADIDTKCYAEVNGEHFYYGFAEECNAGEYLPAHERVCKSCSGTTKYCPEKKKFYKHPKKDQGIYDCPVYGVANANKTACDLQIPKLNMKKGHKGTNSKLVDQCWTTKSIHSYAQCLLSTGS